MPPPGLSYVTALCLWPFCRAKVVLLFIRSRQPPAVQPNSSHFFYLVGLSVLLVFQELGFILTNTVRNGPSFPEHERCVSKSYLSPQPKSADRQVAPTLTQPSPVQIANPETLKVNKCLLL